MRPAQPRRLMPLPLRRHPKPQLRRRLPARILRHDLFTMKRSAPPCSSGLLGLKLSTESCGQSKPVIPSGVGEARACFFFSLRVGVSALDLPAATRVFPPNSLTLKLFYFFLFYFSPPHRSSNPPNASIRRSRK